MSKIGKVNISIPDKVKVSLEGAILKMEGPLGKNNITMDTNIFDLNIHEGKEVSIKPKIINPETKRIWGLHRSLINNAIKGVNEGYTRILELTGVGFRAAIKGNELNLQLGFSHDINFPIPKDIKLSVEKQTIVKISGTDKELVSKTASNITLEDTATQACKFVSRICRSLRCSPSAQGGCRIRSLKLNRAPDKPANSQLLLRFYPASNCKPLY